MASQGAGGPSTAYITPEYLAEDRSYQAHVVFIVTASVVTVVMIARWYSRLALVKKFGLDDYLMTGAWVSVLSFCLDSMLMWFTVPKHRTNGIIVDGRQIWRWKAY